MNTSSVIKPLNVLVGNRVIIEEGEPSLVNFDNVNPRE